MSVQTTAGAVRARAASLRPLALRLVFGTRAGLAVFLGSVCFLGLYWRVGFFITDNYTLANGLTTLADGSLAVEDPTYGDRLDTPGMREHGGRVYPRNYGQLVAALPVLWAFEALTTVADPGLLVPALWSLAVVAFGREAGRVLGRRSLGLSAGALCGLVAFLANAAVARPLEPALLPLLALQTSSLLAAAVAATTLYRLLARMHGRRVGVAGAAVALGATPLGFWATVPKRHVPVAALVLVACYAFYRSRQETTEGALSATGFRGLAYAAVGLVTWVHAGEGFVVFLALLAVDLPTAPSNDRRTLAVVAGAFFLSLLPFFLTNALISGDPLEPPRMLDKFGDLTATSGFGSGSASGDGSSGGDAGSPSTGVVPPVLAAIAAEALSRADRIFSPLFGGAERVLEPDRMYRTFVRGGYIQGVAERDDQQAINLSVLEGGPVAFGLASAVAVGVAGVARRVRRIRDTAPEWRRVRRSVRRARRSPGRATDAFVALLGLGFVLVYIERLPLHAQVTVRYLLVLYPLAVYSLARQQSVRRAVDAHGRTALWAWAGGVLVGGQVLALVVLGASLSTGGAVQVHALLGLAVGAAFGTVALAGVVTPRADRATAALGGLAAALGTDLLLLSGLVYFQYGQYALPAVGRVASALG